jgi:DNA (cytosine-5)-methyltransferase 1
MDLRTTVTLLPAWGKYEPAIRRWEQLTRPAPAPTEPNKNGNPRLASAFSEWLMGWPQGWVTDPAIGISRNEQLRIVGNGVCSQQAAAALRYLLSANESAVAE